ncbi:MAG: trypsin-like peptidase domain-containing protein, partial [candidate division NC10 bacterium]|nr:trypsin-like peptidase domain-containing protein [candidate division NC10 bacterium]
IGNPLGLERSVSEGLVSAIRKVDGVTLIQTTAPISPGSSGGPLFNVFGELVGLMKGSLPEGQNVNVAVAIDHLVDLEVTTPVRLKPLGDLETASATNGAPLLGLAAFIPLLLMGVAFAFLLRSIAKRKGRSRWLWFAAGFVPGWNILGALWLVSLTDLAIKQQLSGLMRELQKSWTCPCGNVNTLEVSTCPRCGSENPASL